MSRKIALLTFLLIALSGRVYGQDLLPQPTKVLQQMQAELQTAASAPAPAPTAASSIPPSYAAIQAGVRKFTDIRSPALAIVAIPADAKDPDLARRETQANAFAAGVPGSRVVRLGGTHYIFISNEADTLREI